MYSDSGGIQVKNRAFSPYAIDGVDEAPPVISPRGIANAAYENTEPELSLEHTHHYEDPSKLADQIRSQQTSYTGPRKKANRLYEPTTPVGTLPDKCSDDDYKEKSDSSCLSRLLLFLILMVSIIALILVIMIIFGKLGPSCLCDNKAASSPSRLVSSGATVSIEPLLQDIQNLRTNLTRLQSQMVKRKEENIALKAEIKILKRSTNANDFVSLQDSLSSVSTRVNITAGRTDEIWNTVTKLNLTDKSIHSALLDINNTLTAKVVAVSRMEGPMGPRGYNGSQGPTGPKGLKGDPGVKGDKGDQGLRGIQGFNGSTGAKGDRGVQGLKGEPGAAGVNGSKGDKGDQGLTGAAGAKGQTGDKGDKGVGDLSACEFKIESSARTSGGANVDTSAKVTEQLNKRIFVAGCSTDGADFVKQMAVQVDSSQRKVFTCKCFGQSSYIPTVQSMICHIAYTECPRNS